MPNFNFRLFLRPSAVGKILIERLTSEGADRQAEARRWIELGYMCEQAGFRLDGTTLFQAGRPAAADQVAPAPVVVHSLPVAAVAAVGAAPANVSSPAPRAVSSAPGAHALAPHALEPQAPSPADPAAERPVEPSTASVVSTASPSAHSAPVNSLDSQLTANLRNLAH